MKRNLNRAVVLLVLFAALLPAQSTGRVAGLITDSAGAVIVNATIKLLIAGSDNALATTAASTTGAFRIVGINPGQFDLKIESAGFQTQVLRNIKIDANRETSLPPVRLEISAVTEVVDVVANAVTVQTTNAEVTNSLANEQFRKLPQLNRSVTALLQTLPGVQSSGRVSTTINGLRPAYVNITYEGINIQDNFIRTNTLDFQPIRLFTDQVAEVSVTTSNTSAISGGGAAQVSFIAPSGKNDYHGDVYWSNRNNAFAANSFFNNRDGVKLPFLNQNQLGFIGSGRIIRNKLFFYGNAEGFRLKQQSTYNRTILTQDARNGLFVYPGATSKVNILQASGRTADPVMKALIDKLPPASAANNYDVGDSTASVLRNTIGYRFATRNNQDRNNYMAKIDYIMNDRHSLTGTWSYADDITDRPDVNSGEGFTAIPPNLNGSKTNFLSIGYRSNPTATLTNEARVGFTISKPYFDTREEAQKFFVAGLFFSSPISTFLPQGRDVYTWNFNNNTAWIKDKHTFQFGVNFMPQRINPYNDASIVTTYTLGIGAGQVGIPTAALPGLAANEITRANSLLSNLAGAINNASVNFNVKDRTSGYVQGLGDYRKFTLDTWALYLTDTWKMNRRLTLNAGIRWEYISVFDEQNSLALLPTSQGSTYLTDLFGNGTLDFAGKGVGRPFYDPDYNNFAPNLGLAWDVRGNGKTAVRMGYSLNFVQDSQSTAIRNSVNTNAGLAQTVQRTGLSSTLASPTALAAPAFKVPRTFQDNYALNTQGAFGMPDPGLATPYVQQWNFSIQQELFQGVLDVRYVGNRSTKMFRAFDFNQVDPQVGGFAADFNRARANGFLAVAAGGTFNPNYNPAIAGSQPLTVLPILGQLTNATFVNYIQTGQMGEMAHQYQITNRVPPGFSFYKNPLSLGLNVMTNYSNANYNAVQLDYTRRLRDLQVQVNYVYSKVMSDTAGDSQAQFEPFLDIANGKLEKSRTPYDVTHQWKGNYIYALPVGKGRALDLKYANFILGGWDVSGLVTWQTGNPISIMSYRGVLNRLNRSNTQNGTTATALVNKSALDDIVAYRMTGTGPMMIAQSAIYTDGRGVAPDGAATFNGQVFINPNQGTLGGLQRRYFSGPSWFNLDFGVSKTFDIWEQHRLMFRMISTNFFNNATFYTGDLDINSNTFGRVTSLQTSPRRIQFELRYSF